MIALLLFLAPAADSADMAFFEAKVRPLLSARCHSCHSTTAKKIRGGLTLDAKEGWQKGGDAGPALVPGKPDDSLLVKTVEYADPDVPHMPPAGKMTAGEIATLREWIRRGAPDPRSKTAAPPPLRIIDLAQGRRFWSFQPLHRTEPPKVKGEKWPRNDVDNFVLAAMEAKKLAPAREADRRTLLRRATFDLTGLPPTPDEVEGFLRDPAFGAWERVLDRLLASPRFGERWARHWLDLARFAESHGYEQDYDRPFAYPFRDFVIEAFNRNLPYNTFVQWQLAGDELAPNEPLALKATGFLAAGTHATQITLNQVEKERYDELDDMTATTGTAMLGLTIGCARCHDHKYDPIPQRDYYRLLSTFTTTVRCQIDVPTDPAAYEKAKRMFDQAHAPLIVAQKQYDDKVLPRRLAEWERDDVQRRKDALWSALTTTSFKAKGGAELVAQPDGSFLAKGKNPDFDSYTVVAETDLANVAAIRLEALADESFVKKGPGRADNGNFALTDFKVTAAPKRGGRATDLTLVRPRATFEQPGLPIKAAIDEDGTSGWAVDPQFGRDHAAVFEFSAPVRFPGGAVFTVVMNFHGNVRHGIGRPRLSVTEVPWPSSLLGAPVTPVVARALAASRGRRTPAEQGALLAWFATIDPGRRRLDDAIEKHLALAPKRPVETVMVSTEGLPAVRFHTQGGDFLEKTHFLKRGDPNQKNGEATQSFLQVLMNTAEQECRWQAPPPKGSRSSYRRAALARWMTDVDHGAGALAARVIVNRLWQHHFGRGIVATPSDFGAQGDRPTHPELLDMLAGELIRNGWRLKPIHKLILASAAYRQSSQVEEPTADDARLFRGWQPQRLEAEALRDSMLAVSGELDPRMFGPGSTDLNQKRRSIYFFTKRSRLIPMLMLFDAPDSLQSLPQRTTTTIAPQALLLINSPIVRGWALAFARRIQTISSDDSAAAVRTAYRLALARDPSSDDLSEALAFLGAQSADRSKLPPAQRRDEALADFCQLLFGLNEFAYVD